MDWLKIFFEIGVTGILLYVFQKVIDERASKRIEQLKASLDAKAFEYQTRFSKLHEKQAEVIANLYKQLLNTQSSLRSLARSIDSHMPNKTGHREDEKAKESIYAFWDFFVEHRIYLPENLGSTIEEFHKRSMETYIRLLSAAVSKGLVSKNDVYQDDYAKDLATASEILADQISPITNEIEREFRKLLGS